MRYDLRLAQLGRLAWQFSAAWGRARDYLCPHFAAPDGG
jgi:hypothetical protein